jgi:teichuronic acid biosynthesis glycosyltransferase TuaG
MNTKKRKLQEEETTTTTTPTITTTTTTSNEPAEEKDNKSNNNGTSLLIMQDDNNNNEDCLPPPSPLVSVIMATYNRWNCLQRAIDSILKQTYRPIEICLTDDGSTQQQYKDAALVEEMHDRCKKADVKLIFHQFPVNQHRSLARNVSLENASGEYLAFLDDDDAWIAPEKLKIQFREMEKENLPFCCCAAVDIYNQTRECSQPYSSRYIPQSVMCTYNPVSGSTVLMRKDLIPPGVKYVCEEAEDHHFWGKIINNIFPLEKRHFLYLSDHLAAHDMLPKHMKEQRASS